MQMQVTKLDHVNVRTTQLEVMTTWYVQVLGLRSGFRPQFSFPGAWLYAGDVVVVHLVGIDSTPGVGSEADLKLEHFALSASGAEHFEQSLIAANEKYRRVELPEINLVLFNIADPDGNRIHVDFSTSE